MIKTFKYRIYPNKTQEKLLNETLWLCKELYNGALEHRQMMLKFYKKKVNYYDQSKELPLIKAENKNYNIVAACVLQNVLKKVEESYKRFFKNISNYPKFKSIKDYRTIYYNNQKFKIKNNKVYLLKVGGIKIKLSRPIDGAVKQIKIHKNKANEWHVLFVCECDENKIKINLKNEIAIDLGISKFATLSNGEVIENPKFFDKSKEKLKQRQQSLSRKVKGSKNWNKAKKLVAKTHLKIKNQREDFQHKTANKLLMENKTVYMEDLSVGSMVSKENNNSLNRNISDASWSGFKEKLKYKSDVFGNTLIFVDPKNTSKTCSGCLNIKENLELSDRIYKCDICNFELDRDLNASYNILRAGQALVAAKA